MKRATIALTTLILALPLVACSEEEPAVCGSADALRSSVDDVRDVDLTAADDLTDLQSALTGVESDFADLKADAKSEFAGPVDAVESSLAALKTSVEGAQAAPAADTLAAAGAALSAFGTAVQTLVEDVESTC